MVLQTIPTTLTRSERLSVDKHSAATNPPTYFNNLNSLRLVAAVCVLIFHIEQIRAGAGLPNIFGHPLLNNLGPKAVKFFFVLSGFLITYLLLKEHQNAGKIDLRKFYIRRILRIWPLYFLTVAIAFFVIPNAFVLHDGAVAAAQTAMKEHFWPALGYYVMFLPNLALVTLPPVPGGIHCWSLGVEEQFYLLWPQLLRLSIRNPITLFLGVILIKGFTLQQLESIPQLASAFEFMKDFFIEAMAIGAVAALFVFQKPRLNLKFACLTVFFLGATISMNYWFGKLVTLIIFAAIVVAATKLRVLSKTLEGLGNYSYGIYMLHPPVLIFLLWLSEQGVEINYFMYYLTAFFLTFALSIASYRFIEAPTLRLKKHFSC